MKELLANRYILASEIGNGGMADVYLAMDTVLNREVAIKILRGDLSADPVSLLRFQREANAASALNHPNIVEIYDIGEDNGRQFIVMEYVRGKTLKKLLFDRGALDVKEAVTIMKQLVSAVSEAHTNGIIHRDIKSQNVLVKDDGTVKITDFGIALAQDAIQLTQTDSVMGSVHYMAPEIARGEIASFQSDIYSLGIVLYELLRGDIPYHGDSPVQIAMKHMEEDIPSIKMYDNSVPQSVENIIFKACCKNKNYRYANCEEMLNDLNCCLDEKHLNDKKNDFLNSKDGQTIKLQKVNSKEVVAKKEKRNILIIGVGASLIALAFIAIVGLLLLGTQSKFQTVDMPKLVGLTVDEAKELCQLNDLVLNTKITYKATSNDKVGTIIATSPLEGQEIEKGTSVSITVCDRNFIIIEDYTGQNYSEVKDLLKNTKITISSEKVQDQSVAAGTIIDQSIEPFTECDPNLSYSLVFTVADSLSFSVPDLMGENVFDAMDALEELGATCELESLDYDDLSESEKETTKRNVVVKMSVTPYSYYTQTEGKKIVLTYYY